MCVCIESRIIYRCIIINYFRLLADYCPSLTAPAHGHINGFRTELHATVGVSCDTGYKVVGTSFRTCEQSRAWSGSDPTCQSKDIIRNIYGTPFDK